MEIENKRVVISIGLVFVLGVLFAVVNGTYTTETNEQLPLIVYAISIISIIIGAVIVLLFQWKINKIQLENVLKVLPPEERVIIKTLLYNKKMLEQNKLVALTGFSKVTVSRVIQKLVQKEVVDKKILGNTNMILLKI